MTVENFEKALEFLFPSEGGYVNNKNDKGGPTNMGITQATLNSYRKRKGLPSKDVKNITREEAKAIYYDDYWVTSGADRISDPNMAVAIFDTAVLHGPGTAKTFYNQSKGDLNKFLQIRQESYDKIVANDPSQKIFYNGWNNRVNNLRNNINSNKFTQNDLPLTPSQSFKVGIEMNVDNNGNKIFTPQEIGELSAEDFEKYMPIIEQQLKEGLIKPQSEQPKDYTNYKNPETGTNKIYTREDISKMSTDEYAKNEKEIMSQMNSIGIPYKNDLPKGTQTHSDTKEKSSSSSAKSKSNNSKASSGDGKWVTINGNHVLIEK